MKKIVWIANIAGFQIVNYESIIIKTVIAKNVKQNCVTTIPGLPYHIYCMVFSNKAYATISSSDL